MALLLLLVNRNLEQWIRLERDLIKGTVHYHLASRTNQHSLGSIVDMVPFLRKRQENVFLTTSSNLTTSTSRKYRESHPYSTWTWTKKTCTIFSTTTWMRRAAWKSSTRSWKNSWEGTRSSWLSKGKPRGRRRKRGGSGPRARGDSSHRMISRSLPGILDILRAIQAHRGIWILSSRGSLKSSAAKSISLCTVPAVKIMRSRTLILLRIFRNSSNMSMKKKKKLEEGETKRCMPNQRKN